MPASYRQAREEFIHLLARLGWRLEAIQAVLKDAGICQRASEVECSVSDRLIRASAEKATEAAWKRLNALVSKHTRARVAFGGDPRGCVVTLYVWSDAAQAELERGVPAEGYRAAQIERMAARG